MSDNMRLTESVYSVRYIIITVGIRRRVTHRARITYTLVFGLCDSTDVNIIIIIIPARVVTAVVAPTRRVFVFTTPDESRPYENTSSCPMAVVPRRDVVRRNAAA